MDVLLVEDDEFKAADITRVVAERLPTAVLTRAASVTSALRKLTADQFNLVILDMSLPTFDLSGPGGGGSPQGQGGVEVLRLAGRMRHSAEYIILTQYPDIELDGSEMPLHLAAPKLSERFSITVRRCIAYEFDSDEWRTEFMRHLTAAQDQHGGSDADSDN